MQVRLRALIAEKEMSSASIEWTQPSQPPNVTAFNATLVDDDGNLEMLAKKDALVTEWTLESILAPGTEYTVFVTSINEHGSSIPSNNVTFTTVDLSNQQRPGYPQAPHSVSLLMEDGEFEMRWKWSGNDEMGKTIGDNVTFEIDINERDQDATVISMNSTANDDGWYTYVMSERLPGNVDVAIFMRAIVDKGGENKRASVTSEVIHLRPDASEDIPEPPTITFTPKKDMYNTGDMVMVECRQGEEEGLASRTLRLHVGKGNYGLGTPSTVVDHPIRPISASDGARPITCTAASPMGLHAHTTVYLPVSVPAKAIPVIAGLETTLECAIVGYPVPQHVQWLYNRTEDDKPQDVMTVNFYESYSPMNIHFMPINRQAFNMSLVIAHVSKTNHSGTYTCKACDSGNKNCVEGTVLLSVEDIPLPKSPVDVENCCQAKGVDRICCDQSAASRYPDPQRDALTFNTSFPCTAAQLPVFYDCAQDGNDHRQCCARNGVSRGCVYMCDRRFPADKEDRQGVNDLMQAGDGQLELRFPVNRADVSDIRHKQCLNEYAGLAMQCTYRDQVTVAIGKIRNVEAYVDVATNRIEVDWQAPDTNAKLVDHYAVYYRDITSNRSQLAKTRDTHIVLDKVTGGRTYEVYVVAVGLNTYSPFTRATDVAHTYHDSAGTSWLWPICLLLVLATAVVAVVWYTNRGRRRVPTSFAPSMPAVLKRWMPRRGGGGEGRVAFENPGYNRDAQIVMEGVGTESVTFERDPDDTVIDSSDPDSQKGMKYSQMK